MKLVFGILVASCCVTSSFAKDEWLCVEASSQRIGSEIQACGIGNGKDENSARLNAFDNARAEFTKLCEASDDCNGHEIVVEPKRTSCERVNESYKCYRMLAFTIKDKRKKSPIELKESPEIFGSFSYKDIQNLPKAKVGMKKEDLFKDFGQPVSKGNVYLPHKDFWGTNATVFNFKGKFCANEYSCSTKAICTGGTCRAGGMGMNKACFGSSECGVVLENDRIIHLINFDIRYTEDLK